MTSTALTRTNGAQPAPALPDMSGMDLTSIGRVLAQSGFFKDSADVNKAIVKILYGREIGLPPVQAMTGIWFFEGKLSLSAATIATVIKRSGRYTYRVREISGQRCRIEFFEREAGGWESIGTSEFTMQDAQTAGLAGKDVWRKYPRNMLLARALTNGARWFCPDLFGGSVYEPEELGQGPLPDTIALTIDDVRAVERPAPAVAVDRSTGEAVSQGPVDPSDGPVDAEDLWPPDPEPAPAADAAFRARLAGDAATEAEPNHLRRLHAAARAYGHDHAAVHDYACQRFGVTSLTELSSAQATELAGQYQRAGQVWQRAQQLGMSATALAEWLGREFDVADPLDVTVRQLTQIMAGFKARQGA